MGTGKVTVENRMGRGESRSQRGGAETTRGGLSPWSARGAGERSPQGGREEGGRRREAKSQGGAVGQVETILPPPAVPSWLPR